MNARHLTALSVLLTACGTDYEDFAAEYPADMCAWIDECAFSNVDADIEAPRSPGGDGPDTSSVCVDQLKAEVEDANANTKCEYEAGVARQCLAALEGTCEERTAIYYECGGVYSGDECESDLSASLDSDDTAAE